jgi:hypothetical protein
MDKEITNDLNFDKVKENYCPRCYFEDDKMVLRNECKHYIQKLKDALIWCSGSNDFQVGGKARDGWVRLCLPLLRKK